MNAKISVNLLLFLCHRNIKIVLVTYQGLNPHPKSHSNISIFFGEDYDNDNVKHHLKHLRAIETRPKMSSLPKKLTMKKIDLLNNF